MIDPEDAHLAEQLETARARLGISVSEAARRCGCTDVWWHKIEKGQINGSPTTWRKLGRVVGLKLVCHFERKEPDA